jgi:8-oxo-dGTP pyrophosphatase MutT (NUDIX family)
VSAPRIQRVTTFDLRVTSWDWPFARTRRGEIDAHFAEAQHSKPKTWNGRVLLARNARLTGDRLAAEYFETDFASFLAWRDWGHPDKDVFNGFGMGALRASDGAFVLGEMAGHTANAGRIYFPAGTPDLDDIKDGTVDIAGSVAREAEEETGLSSRDYRAAPDWSCVDAGVSLAMIRMLQADLPGDALRAKIEANLAQQDQPELSAIHLVRKRSDLTDAMPRFVTAYLEAELPA